jgi:hypothetical protein
MAPTVDRVLERVEAALPEEMGTAGDHVAALAHDLTDEAAEEHGE